MKKGCESENTLFKIVVSEESSDDGRRRHLKDETVKFTHSESALDKSYTKIAEGREIVVRNFQKTLKKHFHKKKKDENPYLKKLIPITKVGYQEKACDPIRIKELHNRLFEFKTQLEDLAKENVQLKTLTKRQEVEIKKLEDTKGELPRLIKTYQEEHRIINIKAKDLKQNNRELERKIKAKDEEIISLKLQNSHLEKLTKDKNLLEREKLQNKMEHLEERMSSLEDTNKKLSKKCELEQKRMMSMLKLEEAKHRETKAQLAEAQKTIEILQGRNTFNYVPHTAHTKKVPPKTEESKKTKSCKIGKISNSTVNASKETPQKSNLPMINLQPELVNQKTVETKNHEVLPKIKVQHEIEESKNDDVFSIDNLEWDELKKYVPKKEELVVKMENMFTHEFSRPRSNSFNGFCDIRNTSESVQELPDKKLSTILNYQTTPDDFDSASENKTFKVVKNTEKNPETVIRKEDVYIQSEQDKTTTKRNNKADILKYIFGKELLFDLNPE